MDQAGKFILQTTGCRKISSVPSRRMQKGIFGWERKVKGWIFSRRENLFPIKAKTMNYPAMVFPLFTWTRMTFCGSEHQDMVWLDSTRENGLPIRQRTASPATTSVTSLKTRRGNYGSGRTPDVSGV